MSTTVGGAFDRLLWNGLRPGEYSLSESEVGAKLSPEDQEAVLLFQLDEPHDELRHQEPDGTSICDGMFFYRRKLRAQPWLLFFELKRGSYFSKAVAQLTSAILLTAKNLHSRYTLDQVHAVVVSGVESPPDQQVLQKQFRAQLSKHKIRASLGFVTCPLKGAADLREELLSRVRAVG